MNFLFWNINKKDLSKNIVLLAEKYSIDIIILAESNIPDMKMILDLNHKASTYHTNHPNSLCKKIKIYTKFHYDFIKPITESERYTIRMLNFPLKRQVLLTAIHFIDKGNHSEESQSIESSLLIDKINQTEDREKNFHNFIIGDFNMNPFEKGMIKSNGFNATMSEDIALNGFRTVQGVSYKYFYNPMWALYGDLYSKPAGTYFYPHSEHLSYQWHVFDQLLIRPDMISMFDKSSLEVITSDGINNFLKSSNKPDEVKFSDHLPIKFTIKI